MVVLLAFGSTVAVTWLPAVLAGRAFAESVAVTVATRTIGITGAAVVLVCLAVSVTRRQRA